MGKTKTAQQKRDETAVYDEAVEIYDGMCALCYRPMAERHHIRYGACGRHTYRGNIIPLCITCHDKVHGNKKKWQPILIEMINERLGIE